MANRIFFATLIFFLLFIPCCQTSFVHADEPGKFDCTIDDTNSCAPKEISPGFFGCSPGYKPNPSACSVIPYATCKNFGAGSPIDCIKDPASPLKGFTCKAANSSCEPSNCNPGDPGCFAKSSDCLWDCLKQTPNERVVCNPNGSCEKATFPSSSVVSLAYCQANCKPTNGGGGGRPVAMPLMECIDGIVQAPNPGKPNTDPAILSTAIGCVPVKDLGLFLQWVLGWLFGAAGAIIVLFLIKLGYDIVTSQGDPQKLQEVKESIISIFSGLILIVFSLVLLKTIGADILGLPGF